MKNNIFSHKKNNYDIIDPDILGKDNFMNWLNTDIERLNDHNHINSMLSREIPQNTLEDCQHSDLNLKNVFIHHEEDLTL